VTGVERGHERLLVDDAAARGVDQQRAALHLGHRRRPDEAAGLVGQRRVAGDEVGAGEELVQVDQLHAEPRRRLAADERVVAQHLHLEAARAVGGDAADVAESDDAEGLAHDLGAAELGLLPLAALHRGGRLRDVAGQREQEAQRVLGGGHRVAAGRVLHDDAAPRGGRDVDVVDADAGPADDLEPLAGLDHVGGDLAARTDQEAVELADDRLEVAGRQSEADVHGDRGRGGQDLGRAGGHLVGDQHS
jgi:hypothetical protein